MAKQKQTFSIALEGVHFFTKVNAVTLIDEKGQYDIVKCSTCGTQGKQRTLHTVEIEKLTTKAEYCHLSKSDIAKHKATAEYKSGTITKLNCPSCNEKLSRTAEWTEQGTDLPAWSVVCLCGYNELICGVEANKGLVKKF